MTTGRMPWHIHTWQYQAFRDAGPCRVCGSSRRITLSITQMQATLLLAAVEAEIEHAGDAARVDDQAEADLNVLLGHRLEAVAVELRRALA